MYYIAPKSLQVITTDSFKTLRLEAPTRKRLRAVSN